MYKKLLIPLCVVVLNSGLVAQQTSQGIETFKQRITINVNGESVVPDLANPMMVEGRVLVPIRGVFEKLGVAIEWHPEHRVVVAGRDGHNLMLGIGAKYGTVNGRFTPLEVPAQIVNGRTMVPLRYLAEALGAYVMWDHARQVVVITTRVNSPVGGTPPPRN